MRFVFTSIRMITHRGMGGCTISCTGLLGALRSQRKGGCEKKRATVFGTPDAFGLLRASEVGAPGVSRASEPGEHTMKRIPTGRFVPPILLLTFLVPPAARAVDLSLKIEPGVAVPLGSPQTDRFNL